MSPALPKLFAPTAAALAAALDPIAAVPGVTDYIFVDARGTPVTRTSHYGYDDERVARCAQALRRSGVVLHKYLGADAPDSEPLAFRFRNGWLLAWRLGGATLIVFGREGLDLPTLRMRASILHRGLADSRRLRRYLAEDPAGGPEWVRETASTDEERCWIDTILEGRCNA